MSELQGGVPAAVYRYLPRGWNLEDPLPPIHQGPVFHYTNLIGVFGLIESKVAWVSHVPDLNDPSERRYGWNVIRERFADRQPQASSGALDELQKIFAFVDEPGSWYPRPFVLSASAAPDSLTQYRLYGQYQVELAGGTWSAAPVDRRGSSSELLAEWRPVLYGPGAAQTYVDRMLAAAVAIMDSVSPEDYADQSLTAMLALEVLALHIKNPAYEDEHEVRLVFSADRSMAEARVRVSGNRLVTYVEASPVDDANADLVEAVRLGPLAGGERTAEALRLHFRNHSRRKAGFYDLEDNGLDVTLSEAPYSV